MRSLLLVLVGSAAFVSAQVQFRTEEIAINIDGKPFTVFHYGTDNNKPFLAPLRSASGKIVTRHFPMEEVGGESHDHLHHRGLWFSYDDVNKVKFWENEPTYTKGVMGKIIVRKTEWKDGTLKASMDWVGPDGKVMLKEDRDMTFYSDPKLRMIDFVFTLTSAIDIDYGDDHDGLFAIRLADAFTELKGGKMIDANGRTGMLQVWGKKSNWVDYTAELEGERLGVAIFDHPQNPRHPTYWHARDYGLFSANPFAQNAFDDKLEESHLKVPAGQKIVFKWRVVIHPGDSVSGHVADMYNQYAAKK
jgi:Methane oxygenase PmoA